MHPDEALASAVPSRVCAAVPDSKPKRNTRPPAPPNAIGFTVRDACLLGGFGRTSLYALARTGKLHLVKVAGRTLVAGDSLRALLNVAK